MNFRFATALSQKQIENFLCYLSSELVSDPTYMKTMENIGCVVGTSNSDALLIGKENVTGTVLEGQKYEVEYMIYDTGRSIIEKMNTMSLENNEPTLKYFENMFSHRSKEWEFT